MIYLIILRKMYLKVRIIEKKILKLLKFKKILSEIINKLKINKKIVKAEK